MTYNLLTTQEITWMSEATSQKQSLAELREEIHTFWLLLGETPSPVDHIEI